MANRENIRVKIEGIDKLTPVLLKISRTLDTLVSKANKVNSMFARYSKSLNLASKSVSNLTGSTRLYIRQLRAESKWNEWLYKDKQQKLKQEENLFKNRLRILNQSKTLEKNYYSKVLRSQERKLRQLIDEIKLKKKLGILDYLNIRREISNYKSLGQKAIISGAVLPQDLQTKLKRFRVELSHLNDEVGETHSLFYEWWKRFGAVALGFTIVYRAMLYFELALSSLIQKVIEGIKAFDTFEETTVRLSMFYQIFGGVRNLGNSMKYASSTVEGLRVAVVDALSPIEDITQGIDELAQHGVFLSASMMKSFVDLTDFIGMIAKTTGSQANQIRQELQALFEGTKRAGNTLIRFISKAFGNELVQQIQNATTPLEQFYFIMKEISSFMRTHKELLFSRSFTLSLTRAVNLFELLVVDSLRLSNSFRNLSENINPFAKSLNDALEKLGFLTYKRLKDARLEFMKYQYLYKEGIISTEEYNQKLEEFINLQKQFEKTTASKVMFELSKAMTVIAEDVIPKIVSVIPSVISGISTTIDLIDRFVNKHKEILSFLFTVFKFVIGFKLLKFILRLSLIEPFLLLYSLLPNVNTSIKTTATVLTLLSTPFTRMFSLLGGFGRRLTVLGQKIAPTTTMQIYVAFSVLYDMLKPLTEKIGNLFKKIFLPKSLKGLIVRAVAVFSLLPAMILAILNFEQFENLGKSIIYSLFKGVNEAFKYFAKKFNLPEQVINFFDENISFYNKKLEKTGTIKDNLIKSFSVIAEGLGDAYSVFLSKIKDPIATAIEKFLFGEEKQQPKVFKLPPVEVKANQMKKLIPLDYLISKYERLKELIIQLSDLDWARKQAFSIEYYLSSLKQAEEQLRKQEDLLRERLSIAQSLGFEDQAEKIKETLETVAKELQSIREKRQEIDLIFSDLSPLQKYLYSVRSMFTEIGYYVEKHMIEIKGVKDFVDRTFQTVADSLYDALTFKLKSFSEFLSSLRNTVMRVIYDILIQLAKLKLMKTIYDVYAPAPSSFIGSGKSVQTGTFAEGGIVNKPTVALIGEAGYPEAVIPMKTGKIPVELRGQQSQPIVVNVNVQAVDVNSFKKYEGQIVEVISNALKKGKLTNQVRRIL